MSQKDLRWDAAWMSYSQGKKHLQHRLDELRAMGEECVFPEWRALPSVATWYLPNPFVLEAVPRKVTYEDWQQRPKPLLALPPPNLGTVALSIPKPLQSVWGMWQARV